MPKLGRMAQISRPFQIVLAAFVLFAAAWFVVLRPSGESSTGSSSPSVASSSRGTGAHSGAATHARGVTHSTKAAHASRSHAKATYVARSHAKTTHASRSRAKTATPSAAERHKAGGHAGASRSGHAGHRAAQQSRTAAATAATAAFTLHNLTTALHLNAVVKLVELLDPALNLKAKVEHGENELVAKMKAALQPASQTTVASDLHHHKTALLLFLNPHSYDDDASAIDAVEVAHRLDHKVAVHLALARQVSSFGSITRDIQIDQTPTLLIVNGKREVTTLTGLIDAYAIEQAVAEARGEAVKLPG